MEFSTVPQLCEKISADLIGDGSKRSVGLLYAFNATGKTRLALEVEKLNDTEDGKRIVLSYNALLEDCFTWDNENCIYKFNTHEWFSQIIIEQGIEGQIADNFKTITNSKIEPSFNFETGEIFFSLVSGDDTAESNIKISRGEESFFIWCIFYSILEVAIEALNTEVSSRTTDYFNDIKFVVVDDPVSSIDDAMIIAVAIRLSKTIKSSKNSQLNFLITTHHALFYNVLFNSFKKGYFYLLSRNLNNTLKLVMHGNDSPFAYHLLMKNKITKAIEDGDVEKYHFNLFRAILEKTANFLGYKNWGDCLPEEDRDEFIRILHLHSHNRLSELEGSSISSNEVELFIKVFNGFIRQYNYQ
jgi:hypothetical protein